MKTTSTTKTIKSLLDKINNGYILLPEFQRNYVWDKNQIEELFESILNGYPIGTFIFWKRVGKEIKKEINEMSRFPNSIDLYANPKRNNSNQEPITNINIKNSMDYWVVLDGQQRLTSLYCVFYKNFYKKGVREKNRMELYFFHDSNKQDKHFVLLNDEKDEIPGNYVKVRELINNKNKLIKIIANKKGKEKHELETFCTNIGLLKRNEGLRHFFEISNCTYDESLSIFVKINSSGTPLTKTQLLLSRLSRYDNSQNIKLQKKEINKFLRRLNYSNGNNYVFQFNIDFFLHVCLVLIAEDKDDRKLNINNIGKQANLISDNIKKIEESCVDTTKILKQLGFCNACISSYNSIIPIIYFRYKNKTINKKDYEEIRKYIMITNINGLFSSSTDDKLNRCFDAIDKMKNKSFDLSLFSNEGLDMKVNINKILESKKGDITRNVLYYLQAKNSNPYNNNMQQDHLHPKYFFEKEKYPKKIYKNGKLVNMTKADKERWKENCDRLPNLDILNPERNNEKKKMSLEKWLSTHDYKFKYGFDEIKNKSLENFDYFYKKRKKILKKEIDKLFN